MVSLDLLCWNIFVDKLCFKSAVLILILFLFLLMLLCFLLPTLSLVVWTFKNLSLYIFSVSLCVTFGFNCSRDYKIYMRGQNLLKMSNFSYISPFLSPEIHKHVHKLIPSNTEHRTISNWMKLKQVESFLLFQNWDMLQIVCAFCLKQLLRSQENYLNFILCIAFSLFLMHKVCFCNHLLLSEKLSI